MTEGIHMRWAVIAHQQSARLIGKTALEILHRLLMQVVFPDDGFQMAWIDLHTLINFLTKIDHSGHRLTSFVFLLQSAITMPANKHQVKVTQQCHPERRVWLDGLRDPSLRSEPALERSEGMTELEPNTCK